MSTHRQEPPQQNTPAENLGIRAFQLDGSGLRRIMGSLEADLLEAVWRLTSADAASKDGWTTIAAICTSLTPTFNYKTAQTVMNRLVEKRLLLRREWQRAFEYRAAISRDDLISQVTRSVVGGLIHDFGDVAIAQLAQALHETHPDLMAQLESLASSAPHELADTLDGAQRETPVQPIGKSSTQAIPSPDHLTDRAHEERQE